MAEKYQRLRDLREDHDLSQQRLADQLGMYKTVYSNYELGKREIPFSLVVKLAKFYDVSIDYIAGLTNKPSKLSEKEKR
ncbi:MAG: helix-turn-helix transcriptional regulator [Clostridia bacterium]|nr:helix-turn-helix transcriptional regulator [Clostridia bacterium]